MEHDCWGNMRRMSHWKWPASKTAKYLYQYQHRQSPIACTGDWRKSSAEGNDARCTVLVCEMLALTANLTECGWVGELRCGLYSNLPLGHWGILGSLWLFSVTYKRKEVSPTMHKNIHESPCNFSAVFHLFPFFFFFWGVNVWIWEAILCWVLSTVYLLSSFPQSSSLIPPKFMYCMK